MPRVSNIELYAQPACPVIMIRTKTTLKELPRTIGESLGKIGAYLGENGMNPAEVPFTGFHNFRDMDPGNIEVEIGFPVASMLPAREDMMSMVRPEILVAACIYRGPYDGLMPVYEEMIEWAADRKYTLGDTSYEYYLNGPEFPESEMLTRTVIPIAG